MLYRLFCMVYCLFVMFSESVMCYVGQFMKNSFYEKFNSNKITLSRCPGTAKCVTVDYKMEIYGISMQIAQGICGKKLLDCDAVCDSMKKIMQNRSLLNCKVRLYYAEAAVQKFPTVYVFYNFRSSWYYFSFCWFWPHFILFISFVFLQGKSIYKNSRLLQYERHKKECTQSQRKKFYIYCNISWRLKLRILMLWYDFILNVYINKRNNSCNNFCQTIIVRHI